MLWMSPGHLSRVVFLWEEAPRQTQDTLERLEEASGELCLGCCLCDPDKAEEDETTGHAIIATLRPSSLGAPPVASVEACRHCWFQEAFTSTLP